MAFYITFLEQQNTKAALESNTAFSYKAKDKFPTSYADVHWVQKNLLTDKVDTIQVKQSMYSKKSLTLTMQNIQISCKRSGESSVI